MSSEGVDENQENKDTNVSPGHLLKETREAKGLSQTEIAQRLRLDSHLINDLEAENEENLPAPIYVTGYLRAYARLLGLDEDQLISHYPHATDTTTILIPENIDYGSRPGIRLPLGLILVLIPVVVGLAVVWWWVDDRPEGVEKSLTLESGHNSALPDAGDSLLPGAEPLVSRIPPKSSAADWRSWPSTTRLSASLICRKLPNSVIIT